MDVVPLLLEHSPYAGLFFLLILGGFGLPFPEDATLIACGFLISHDAVKPIPALITVYTTLLITDLFIYGAGRRYGRGIVTHRRFQRVLTSERLAVLEDRFKRQGMWFILIGRHVLGLRAQLFLIAGIMKMQPGKFLLADAIAALTTSALMVGMGYIGGNNLNVVRKDITRMEHVAVVAALAALIVFVFIRYYKSRRTPPL